MLKTVVRTGMPAEACVPILPQCKDEEQKLKRITILGDRTRHQGIQDSDRPEPWLEGAPICSSLADYGMIHLGVVEAYDPYRFIRPVSIATEVLACFGGRGMVLIDGEWTECHAGQAVLIPQYSAIGYYAVGNEPWKMVWVCYQPSGGGCPIITPSSPVMADYDPALILHAVEGLRLEGSSARDSVCMESWVKLIHRLVLRFAQPWQQEDKLQVLWEKVAARLEHPWTLDSLATEAGCCSELLRQRCHQYLGRSPMQHLTYLRMQRAAQLLVETDEKIPQIASRVGYRDAVAFSVAFKKWTGCPPSELRE